MQLFFWEFQMVDSAKHGQVMFKLSVSYLQQRYLTCSQELIQIQLMQLLNLFPHS